MNLTELPGLYPHQNDMRDRTRASLMKHRRVILCAQAGTGKCLGAGTPVMKFDGTICYVEDIIEGERLMGPDGHVRYVTSTATGEGQLYRIVPSCGDPFVVNADHILCLKVTNLGKRQNSCGGFRSGHFVTMTVEEYISQPLSVQHNLKGYRSRIPVFYGGSRTDFSYCALDMPIEPYFFGLWLADGSHRDPEITTADDETIGYLASFCSRYGLRLVFRGNTGQASTWAITAHTRDINWVRDILRRCSIDGLKFVPHIFKVAAWQDRREVLAGFIDGDGHLTNNCFDIAQKSKSLIYDMAFIARSLGLRATMVPCVKKCTNTGAVGTYYRMTISGDTSTIPTRLPRKQASPRKQKKDPLVFGFEVQNAGIGPYYGFDLAGEDRRFLLGDFTVTHNTRISKWILGSSANRDSHANQSGHSLFAVHRRGLVDNAIGSFREPPELTHGVIMSGVPEAYGHRVQVASIDTLLSWFVENDSYQTNLTFDLVVIDEAHSHNSKFARFLKYHDAYREELGLHPAYVIGLTATPQAKGLADVYREIVQGPATQWLIDNQYLSPFRYFRATQGRLEKLVRRGGDFTSKSESAAMDGLSGDLVRDWTKFAEGRPTVGFFPRRAHAQNAMTELRKAGLRVSYVDGNTPDEVRRQTFWELNNHKIDYLANVQVVERGTDIPAIACVQLCVAVGSIVRYRQLVGRGSRVHPGKTDCVVLDHGGSVQRLGFFEDDPEWSLDITSKEPGEVGTRPTIECPQCQAIYRGGRCNSCGYEPTAKQRKQQGLVFDGKEMKEIQRESQEKPKKQKSPNDLMVSCLFRAGLSGRTWRQCVGIFYREAEKQGTKYRVPRTVRVGQYEYRMLRHDDEAGHRRVSALFPFTTGRGHGGAYLVEQRETVGERLPY